MIQTILFFILTVLAVSSLAVLLILTAYCAIIGRMKKLTPKHLMYALEKSKAFI